MELNNNRKSESTTKNFWTLVDGLFKIEAYAILQLGLDFFQQWSLE